MNDPDLRLFAILLLVAAIAALGWYFRDALLPQPVEAPAVVETPAPAPVPVVEQPAPQHPLPTTVEGPAETDLVPLPDLDDSDEYFLLELSALFGANIERLLVNEALIDRFVATIDNLPRKQVANTIRPTGPLADSFVVDELDDETFQISPDNYARYDLVVETIARANLDDVVATYRRFYPLLDESYQRLGYPDAYFNDRVIEVIDHLLDTPEPDEPLLLVRPNVLYEYTDPELQSLSAGQKLLLRIGNDHAAVIKTVLSQLRSRIAN